MATRKIRLTLSGTQVDNVGPLIDIDFNGKNIEADLDVYTIAGAATLVKEYTVDADPGVYNLEFNYKNDVGGDVDGDPDRNLIIEKIEIADNGVDYSLFRPTPNNSSLAVEYQVPRLAMMVEDENDPNSAGVLNPDFDPTAPRTDTGEQFELSAFDPGDNAKYQWHTLDPAVTVYKNGTTTFNITFS